ncbi:MAG: hypothetical protein KJ072_15005 [Verrucomicrobia bacterium]|nr:hypothetical protein [Verrucomicrobiota bacterium]
MAGKKLVYYMAALILILAVLNLVAGEWSVTGRRLPMSQHPVFVRLRWFALGAVAASLIVGHDFARDDWYSWALAALLALGAARIPAPRKKTSETFQQHRAANGSQPFAPKPEGTSSGAGSRRSPDCSAE